MGCGWLGLELAKTFISNGVSVRGSTSRKEKLPLLEGMGIDPFIFRTQEGLSEVAKAHIQQADVLVLNIPPGRKSPERQKAYREAMHELAKFSSSLSQLHILFVSSTGVYRALTGQADEKTVLNSQTPYQSLLIESESLFQSQNHTVLRLAGLIGGQRHPIYMLQGKTDQGMGNAPVNLIHREDAIGLIKSVIEQEAWGEILLGVAKEKPLKKVFYPVMALKFGLTPPSYQDDEGSTYLQLDNTYTRTRLNYSFRQDDPYLMPVEARD